MMPDEYALPVTPFLLLLFFFVGGGGGGATLGQNCCFCFHSFETGEPQRLRQGIPALPCIRCYALYQNDKFLWSHAWRDKISIPTCQCFAIVQHWECLLGWIYLWCVGLCVQGLRGQSKEAILFIDILNYHGLMLGEMRSLYLLANVSWEQLTFWIGLLIYDGFESIWNMIFIRYMYFWFCNCDIK